MPVGGGTAAVIVDQFVARYTRDRTRKQYRLLLTELFQSTGRLHPSQLTAADLIGWVDPPRSLSNNSVRNRRSLARTFLRWCAHPSRQYADPAVADDALGPDSPLARIHRTYGKVQDVHPPRFLSTDEARRLLAACHDDTEQGMRDEIALRLGLLGMRAAEIMRLQWSDITTEPPRIAWTGKGRRPRSIQPTAGLLAALTRYSTAWRSATGHAPDRDDPVICACRTGNTRRTSVDWRSPMKGYQSLHALVTKRARIAQLGHVAPHDLRRTAAAMLHDAKGTDGGHLFDLLDIQQFLGHADPATTMKSYLAPMDTAVVRRAADTLDL